MSPQQNQQKQKINELEDKISQFHPEHRTSGKSKDFRALVQSLVLLKMDYNKEFNEGLDLAKIPEYVQPSNHNSHIGESTIYELDYNIRDIENELKEFEASNKVSIEGVLKLYDNFILAGVDLKTISGEALSKNVNFRHLYLRIAIIEAELINARKGKPIKANGALDEYKKLATLCNVLAGEDVYNLKFTGEIDVPEKPNSKPTRN